MKHEPTQGLHGATAHATIAIDDVRWSLYVFAVSRVGRDAFVQMALIGPRNCTVTVRTRAPIGNPLTARRVLAVVREWLVSEDAADHAYLEVVDRCEMAS